MGDRVVDMGEGFWNIRGSFKLLGLLDIGTQSSLVRLASGKFVLLDAYTLAGEVEREVFDLTDGGKEIEAVLNLHPFHTVHAESVARQLPQAKQYGTARHVRKFPNVNWEPVNTEDPELHERYATDLSFTVPRGVDFIPANQNLHFASVIAVHRASKSMHVDDTLTWTRLPLIGGLSFHPTLRQVLQKRPGAAAEFRSWVEDFIARCEDVEHLCTAHARELPPAPDDNETYADQVRDAYDRIKKTVDAHERRYG